MTLIGEQDDHACGSGSLNEATMLSSSVHGLVVRRIQSSALLKWQTADPRKSLEGSPSAPCHAPQSTTKGTKDTEIANSLTQENCDDDDDCCSELSNSSNHQRGSHLSDLSVTSCHSRTSNDDCSDRVREKKNHYRKLLAQKMDALDLLMKDDVSNDREDEASSTDSSNSCTRITASANTTHQDAESTISTMKTRTEAGSKPAATKELYPRKTDDSVSPKSQFRRVKSSDVEGKKAGGTKMRRAVSDDRHYKGQALSPLPCRDAIEAKKKRVAALTNASAHSSKPKSLSRPGGGPPKRTVSDLDLGKNSRLAKPDGNTTTSETRSRIKRSVSSHASISMVKEAQTKARAPRSSNLDLRTLVDSRTNTLAIRRSSRKITGTDEETATSETHSRVKRSVSSKASISMVKEAQTKARTPLSSILDLRTLVDSKTNTSAILRSSRKMTGAVSGLDLDAMRRCQSAEQQGRRNITRTISADDILDRLKVSYHVPRTVGADAAPGKPIRRTSHMLPSKNGKRRSSKSPRPISPPPYNWEQGIPLTPPSA
jgi:hypothetical protein